MMISSKILLKCAESSGSARWLTDSNTQPTCIRNESNWLPIYVSGAASMRAQGGSYFCPAL